MANKRRKKPVRGRAHVPPPGSRHKDLKKEREKYKAREKVEPDED